MTYSTFQSTSMAWRKTNDHRLECIVGCVIELYINSSFLFTIVHASSYSITSMTHVKMLAAHNEHEREDGYQDNELRIDWHG